MPFQVTVLKHSPVNQEALKNPDVTSAGGRPAPGLRRVVREHSDSSQFF